MFDLRVCGTSGKQCNADGKWSWSALWPGILNERRQKYKLTTLIKNDILASVWSSYCLRSGAGIVYHTRGSATAKWSFTQFMTRHVKVQGHKDDCSRPLGIHHKPVTRSARTDERTKNILYSFDRVCDLPSYHIVTAESTSQPHPPLPVTSHSSPGHGCVGITLKLTIRA